MCWFFSKKDKEKIAILEQKIIDLEKMIKGHIENDKDITQGDDETTWKGY